VATHGPDRRRVAMAATTASLMMFVFGLTYRALASRQGAPVNTTRLDPAVLQALPRQIGDWTGQDVPLSEALVEATGSDAYINRQYSRRNGTESVSLYVACGANVNAVMSHRPMGCYRRTGWLLVDRRSMELPLSDGGTFPCTVYHFRRGDLDAEAVTVLHYCFAGGRYFDEVMKVLATGWRGMHAVNSAAQVEIVASGKALAASAAARLVRDFAVDSAMPVNRILESIEGGQSARDSHETLPEK
jgi:EpsI family protein